MIDVIKLAREAGWTEYSLLHSVEVQRLERFAELVAALEQQAEVLDAEIVHFAKTALHEMPRPATDWHHCAKRVCEAVVQARGKE
jgi:hypothetical protein